MPTGISHGLHVVTTKPRPSPTKRPRGVNRPRQRYAVSLPLPLASRVEALCDLHPDKTRAELITDLLALGLLQVDRAAAESGAHSVPCCSDTRQPIYLLTGPFSEFHGLTFKHHLALERELDETDPLSEHGAEAYELGDVR